ncbi:unnamed protein product [Paramecium sonneborni]|uniref:Uncharacterized protein n=1 Tax=Paramecium sonneborni TaxID=65129 RepID=A0A8S1P279_9CILI|nr:unnamed protein product [Paramecium sonneborni]
MKSWQNKLIIAQKVRRNDDYINRIKYFEINQYLQTQVIQDHLLYEFPQSECFSLAQLIESMKFNFTKIYKGQLLIIILEVLYHLQRLHQNTKLSHGKLIPQNIIFQLTNDPNRQLTIEQTKFSIKQVYFINYQLIEDLNYQINVSKDILDIVDCSIALIKAIQDQNCQLLQYIEKFMINCKNLQNEDNLDTLVNFFKLQINECVDLKEQKVKKVIVYTSSDQLNVQAIQCQELDECFFNFLQKRTRVKNDISNFIESLFEQQVTNKIKYQNNKIKNDELQQQHYDTSKLNQDELRIFNIFDSIMKQNMMKTIWEKYGQFLESQDSINDDQFEKIVDALNQNNKAILTNSLSLVLQEFKNANKINDIMKEEIEKNYKFEIKYDKQKAEDLFILELLIEAQNYDSRDIKSFINTIKLNVKQELQEHYNDILILEILKLIDNLI